MSAGGLQAAGRSASLIAIDQSCRHAHHKVPTTVDSRVPGGDQTSRKVVVYVYRQLSQISRTATTKLLIIASLRVGSDIFSLLLTCGGVSDKCLTLGRFVGQDKRDFIL
jgi:hypothetical protein